MLLVWLAVLAALLSGGALLSQGTDNTYTIREPSRRTRSTHSPAPFPR